MKELLAQIESTQKLPGWCTLYKANHMASLVMALRPHISIEAGIFGGRSFLPIALAHKFIGTGMAIGVEPWTKEAAAEGYVGENKQWWENAVNLAQIQSEFLKQLPLLGVQNVVKVVQMKFQDFTIPDRVGLFHLDNQHTPQSLKDVRRVAPKMVLGGAIVLDDLHWENGGKAAVLDAAGWLADNGFRELCRIFNKPQGGQDDYAVYQKVRL